MKWRRPQMTWQTGKKTQIQSLGNAVFLKRKLKGVSWASPASTADNSQTQCNVRDTPWKDQLLIWGQTGVRKHGPHKSQ